MIGARNLGPFQADLRACRQAFANPIPDADPCQTQCSGARWLPAFQGTSTVAEGTRERVLAAADDLNYVPLGAARSLAVSRHELLGLVLPELGGPYHSELLMGFESRASELGLGVIVVVTLGKPEPGRAIRQIMSRVDAITVLGSDLDDAMASSRRPSSPPTSSSRGAARCSSSEIPTPAPTLPAGMPDSRLRSRLTVST